MNLRTSSYLLIGIATAVVLVSLLALRAGANRRQPWPTTGEKRLVQALQATPQTVNELSASPTSQVMVGTPEFYDKLVNIHYTYRNELPQDQTKLRTLYLIDTQSGQETRLGDDNHAAIFGAINDEYLLWFYWGEGIHLYSLATGEDRFIYKATSTLKPQIAGDWIAFGYRNQAGRDLSHTLYVANVQTNEIITVTRSLNAYGSAALNEYFGISDRLVAWFDPPGTLMVYDLNTYHEITRLTEINNAFNEPHVTITQITPGESVVTWTKRYGYDLVTRSYFRIEQRTPPGSVIDASLADMSRIQEANRVLTWSFKTNDGTYRHIRAPLLDATPSTEPCVAGQNLIQNGDLEDSSAHHLWQQSGSSSDLIINELPPAPPQAGQWAIRLGRYSNVQPTIQQTLNIPSSVQGITLTFDVRANSWDIWGGDRLQVDLVDPVNGTSLLETPVQWTNVQLASGDWIPLQVAIENWPGIDTPLQLVFRAQTDWAFPTDFTIDNIRFITSCQ